MSEKTNNTGIFIIELKKPYKILECDRKFMKMMHYSSEQLKKIHYLRDILEKDEYDDFTSSLQYQLKRSNYTSDRTRLIKGDGKTYQILVNGQAFSLKDGREILQCSCADISTLETSALLTEQAFSDLEIFSQSVRCGLSRHICDNSLTLVWANDYFYQLFGYDKAEYTELYGESMIPLIYEQDLHLVVNSITNLVEDHEIDITFRIKHKTDTFRWVNLIAASLAQTQENEEEFATANFVINDVTTLKLAEMRANLEAQKYAIIADISEEIPFEYEIESDTITYAKKYETIFGRKSIYRNPKKQFTQAGYISAETINNFTALFDAAKNGEEQYNTEYQLQTKKGNYEWHYSTFSLIKNENGEPLRAVGIIRNVNNLKKEHEALLKRAQTDSMTGLLNKATIEAFVQENLKNLQTGTNGVLMLIDIDDFKNVNDTYGHLIGDEVIISIANTLMRFSFNEGFLGRIGGDEFLVFLPNILDVTLACEKAEKYANELRTKYPGNNGKPKVTLSIGIAATDIPIPYSDLLEKADAAVYQAKLNGKNGYVLYNDSLERSEYHNERKDNACNYNPVILSNAISILNDATDTITGIQNALNYIGNTLKIDRISIVEYQSNRSYLSKTIEWVADDCFSDGTTAKINAFPLEEIDSLSITGTYHTTNVKAMKLNTWDKWNCEDVTEMIQSKFSYKNTAIGYIGYLNYSENNTWSTKTIETCSLFSKTLTPYMQRKLLEEKTPDTIS